MSCINFEKNMAVHTVVFLRSYCSGFVHFLVENGVYPSLLIKNKYTKVTQSDYLAATIELEKKPCQSLGFGNILESFHTSTFSIKFMKGKTLGNTKLKLGP